MNPNNTDNLEWQILPADNLLHPETYVSKFLPNAIDYGVISSENGYNNFSWSLYYDFVCYDNYNYTNNSDIELCYDAYSCYQLQLRLSNNSTLNSLQNDPNGGFAFCGLGLYAAYDSVIDLLFPNYDYTNGDSGGACGMDLVCDGMLSCTDSTIYAKNVYARGWAAAINYTKAMKIHICNDNSYSYRYNDGSSYNNGNIYCSAPNACQEVELLNGSVNGITNLYCLSEATCRWVGKITNVDNIYMFGKEAMTYSHVYTPGNGSVLNVYIDTYENLYPSNSDKTFHIHCNEGDICNVYCFDKQLTCNHTITFYGCDNTNTSCNVLEYFTNTDSPTLMPTTSAPSMAPTQAPTLPTEAPSTSPTVIPSVSPSSSPSSSPTQLPSHGPISPTVIPSTSPSSLPTTAPTPYPSNSLSIANDPTAGFTTNCTCTCQCPTAPSACADDVDSTNEMWQTVSIILITIIVCCCCVSLYLSIFERNKLNQLLLHKSAIHKLNLQIQTVEPSIATDNNQDYDDHDNKNSIDDIASVSQRDSLAPSVDIMLVSEGTDFAVIDAVNDGRGDGEGPLETGASLEMYPIGGGTLVFDENRSEDPYDQDHSQEEKHAHEEHSHSHSPEHNIVNGKTKNSRLTVGSANDHDFANVVDIVDGDDDYDGIYILKLVDQESQSLELEKYVLDSGNARIVAGRWYLGDTIGKGSFGWVKTGYEIDNKRKVALKFVPKAGQRIQLNKDKHGQQIESEIQVLSQISHPHIVKLLAYALDCKYPADKNENGKDFTLIDTTLFVFEFANKGELFNLLYYTKSLEEHICSTYLRQLVSGLECLHMHGIIHRDIKPSNLLLDRNFNLKIADLGLCKIFDNERESGHDHYKPAIEFKQDVNDLSLSDSSDDEDEMKDEMKSEIEHKPIMIGKYGGNEKVGTHGYIAPEILLGNGHGTPCDVFSVGVVLFILLNGYLPFKSGTIDDSRYKYIIQHKFEQFWSTHGECVIFYNLHARNLIEKMLEFDVNKRISLETLQKHYWYKNTPYVEGNTLQQALSFRHAKMKDKIKQDREKKRNSIWDEESKVECVFFI